MKKTSLEELYVSELGDLYDAENQLLKALPKMIKASSSDKLREGFQLHLDQTREHAERLEQIFNEMEKKPKRKKCKGMEGLIHEGAELIQESRKSDVLDAGLIKAAQKVEHYEIAGYGCVRTYAELLGQDESAKVLQQTLNEEKATDDKLTQLATSEINLEAADEESDSEEVGSGRSRPRKRAAARKK
jgi:ferritin-like metal-binding protein YciE